MLILYFAVVDCINVEYLGKMLIIAKLDLICNLVLLSIVIESDFLALVITANEI